jgi:hypothetical protein
MSEYQTYTTKELLAAIETAPYYFGPAAIDTFANVVRTDTGPDWHYGRALATGVLCQIGLHFPEGNY